MRFADAHIHFPEYPDGSVPAFFVACPADRQDWDILPEGGVRCYGIHPWYCDLWNDGMREQLIGRLEADPAAGVGEIGLDSEEGVLEEQMECFVRQFDAASEMGRFVSVHNVGADEQITRTIKEHGKGCSGVILHAFSSDSMPVRDLADRGCYFSISPRLMARRRERIRQLLSKIPEERLLIETDAPHLPKQFVSMERFIGDLADILEMEADDLASLTEDNLRRVTGWR